MDIEPRAAALLVIDDLGVDYRGGARVLYGDTDSVFVLVDETVAVERAREIAEALRARVQDELCAQVKSEWQVEPRFELELEHVYERFFQPSGRGGTPGSRKRARPWARVLASPTSSSPR